MITVRVQLAHTMAFDFLALEKKLNDAGIPSFPKRDGFLKSFFESETDTLVFEYTPIEEARLPPSVNAPP